MLAQPISPAAQTGEDQSSHAVFASREAHQKLAFIGLLGAARTVATYLKKQYDEPASCIDVDHYLAVDGLFEQIKRAEALGMTWVGADQLAAAGMSSVDMWSVLIEPFTATSLEDLVRQNDRLRPGDVVYKADTIYRHTLTKTDLIAAGRPA